MSRAKTPLAAIALALASVSACASAPDPEAQAAAQVREAMEAAMQPATQEEIDAANHSDPLTKANFWSKEYAKDAENIDNAASAQPSAPSKFSPKFWCSSPMNRAS